MYHERRTAPTDTLKKAALVIMKQILEMLASVFRGINIKRFPPGGPNVNKPASGRAEPRWSCTK